MANKYVQIKDTSLEIIRLQCSQSNTLLFPVRISSFLPLLLSTGFCLYLTPKLLVEVYNIPISDKDIFAAIPPVTEAQLISSMQEYNLLLFPTMVAETIKINFNKNIKEIHLCDIVQYNRKMKQSVKLCSKATIQTMYTLLQRVFICPNIDPLVICILSGEYDLVDKYLEDKRSNKFLAYTLLKKHYSKDISVILKVTHLLLPRYLYCRDILSKDVSYYMLTTGLL